MEINYKTRFECIYNNKHHNPHDINAYNRSGELPPRPVEKKSPSTIIESPGCGFGSQYQAQVKGKDVTKVKLVGTKQSQHEEQFRISKKFKSVMDKKPRVFQRNLYWQR